jgi:hypothetical protein
MTPELIVDLLGRGSGIAGVALAVTYGVNAITTAYRTRVGQKAITNRLGHALQGTDPEDRAEIIRALSELEERSSGSLSGARRGRSSQGQRLPTRRRV